MHLSAVEEFALKHSAVVEELALKHLTMVEELALKHSAVVEELALKHLAVIDMNSVVVEDKESILDGGILDSNMDYEAVAVVADDEFALF